MTPDIMRGCGVYEIVNLVNEHRYIGSSVNIAIRKINHFCQLNGGTHCNGRLQEAYKEYGADKFEIHVLLRCDPDTRLYYEQIFMDYFSPEYNIRPTSGPHATAEETKAKITIGTKKSRKFTGDATIRRRDDLFAVGGIWGGANGQRSIRRAIDPSMPIGRIARQTRKGNGKIDLKVAIEIHRLTWEEDLSHRQIIEKLGLDTAETNISEITCGNNWRMAYAIYHWGVDKLDPTVNWGNGFSRKTITEYEKWFGVKSRYEVSI